MIQWEYRLTKNGGKNYKLFILRFCIFDIRTYENVSLYYRKGYIIERRLITFMFLSTK